MFMYLIYKFNIKHVTGRKFDSYLFGRVSALIAKCQIFINIDVFSVSIYVLSERVTKILEIIELQVTEKSPVYIFVRSISYAYDG